MLTNDCVGVTARHDTTNIDVLRTVVVIPSTPSMSFRTLFFVIPSVAMNPVCGCFAPLSMTRQCHSGRSEESSVWMLRFVQHDKAMSLQAKRGIQHGCFTDAPLSMTRQELWMRHFVRHSRQIGRLIRVAFAERELHRE